MMIGNDSAERRSEEAHGDVRRRAVAAVVDTGKWQETGLSRVNKLAIAAIQKYGWEVRLQDTSALGRNWATTRWRDCFRIAVNALGWLPRLAVTSKKCNVIYTTLGSTSLGFIKTSIVVWYANIARKRVIVHNHSGAFRLFYLGSSRSMRRFIKATLDAVDAAIVVHETYSSHLRFSSVSVYVVLNGVEEGRRARDIKWAKPIKLLFVGNLHAEKGYFELAKAVSRRRQKIEDVELRVVGGVPSGEIDTSTFAEFLSLLQVDNGIRYLGVLDHTRVQDEISTSHFLCLPSQYYNEALPMVVLEAFSTGRPAIVSNFRALKNIVSPKFGFVVDVLDKDLDSLLSTVSKMSGETYERMKGEAYKQWQKLYSIEEFDRRMQQILERVAPWSIQPDDAA